MKEKFRITSTFWICITMLLTGAIIGYSFYISNANNGRYEYKNGLVIDKVEGTAKEIKFVK